MVYYKVALWDFHLFGILHLVTKFIVCCIWNVRKWPSFLVTLFKKVFVFWWIWSSVWWLLEGYWQASHAFSLLANLKSTKSEMKATEIRASWSLRYSFEGYRFQNCVFMPTEFKCISKMSKSKDIQMLSEVFKCNLKY